MLDRDGVINFDSDDYIKSPDEWLPIPGSLDAIARLNRGGYLVAVATNQAAVGRGLMTLDVLDSIHRKMQDALRAAGAHIDVVVYCPHAPEAQCECRKPKAGLLRMIGERFGVDLRGAPFVGDSIADVHAAMVVGAKPILVLTGKGMTTLHDPSLPVDVAVFGNLADAVASLLERPSKSLTAWRP